LRADVNRRPRRCEKARIDSIVASVTESSLKKLSDWSGGSAV
jgi:hypothetical protein